MKNPVPNKFTRLLVQWFTDNSDGYCIVDHIRRDEPDAFKDAGRLKRATIALLVTDAAIHKLPWLWRNLLLTAIEDPCGVDWNYVSTSLTTDHAAN